MTNRAPHGIPVSTINPKYLHSNSTSHIWPFGAIAELIDNAYDPDVNAKHIWIDRTVIQDEECLTFMDDGNGMDYETMHKMTSFGYSDKVAKAGKAPIGMYGNGFKSGSMRLGQDVIVFSKSKSVCCIGMLSQTYLREIQSEQIVVPIVCFEKSGSNKFTISDEHKDSLQAILQYSPFKIQDQLIAEIHNITASVKKNTGTRIIIWNLRRLIHGNTEFDFDTDRYDILLPQDVDENTNDNSPSPAVKSTTSDIVHSLRAYCRILYLKPRIQIIIRGRSVKSELIAKSLALTRKDHYTPNTVKKPIPIIFGYNTRSKEQYGAMMYHKNRLIKAYERVGCQLRAIRKGVGVIAVIECDFIEPTHNKQHFLDPDKYRRTMKTLGVKLEEYWEEIRYKRKKDSTPVEDTIKGPDQNWVQCDSCQKWRKLPDDVDCNKLPDKWYCRLNPDPKYRNCEVEEEPEDLEDEQPYRKTYKQQQKDNKKKSKEQEMEEPSLVDQMIQNAAAANKTLDRQYYRLRKKLFEKPDKSPSTPTTSSTKLVEKESISGGSPGSVWSPASNTVCSPASKDCFPVIADIRSLATPPQGQKRLQTDKILTPTKKPKVMACPEDSAPDKAAVVNPQVPDSDLNKQKEEESKIYMQMGVENATTQTDIRVKLEKLSQKEKDVMEAQIFRPQSREPPLNFSPSQKPVLDKDSMHKEMMPRLHPSSPPHVEDEGRHSSICRSVHPSVSEIQQLRGQVEELTKERNSLQEQVQVLTSQLQKAHASLQAMPEPTDEQQGSRPEEGLDYKSLFEKAQLRVDELAKDKEELQAAAERKSREVQPKEDNASMQFDVLLMELDECRVKRDKVLSECEQLRLKLKQAEDAQKGVSVSPHAGPSKAEMAAESLSKSLRELRQNVARLLVKHVPVLELNQVNFDCNVIDEILEQCLENQ